MADKVKQQTLLNLGRHFDVHKRDWQPLSLRIQQLLEKQESILSLELNPDLEALAQRYAAQIIARQGQQTSESPDHLSTVNLDSLELVRPRGSGLNSLPCRPSTSSV